MVGGTRINAVALDLSPKNAFADGMALVTWLFLLFSLLITQGSYAQFGYSFPPPPPSIRDLHNPSNWIGIIGDSGASGAASDPNILPVIGNLLGHIGTFLSTPRRTSAPAALSNFPNPQRFGIEEVLPMRRIHYSQREFDEATKAGGIAVQKLNLAAKASLALDVMEHSFGYMVGRGLGIAAQDIVFVGEDGRNVSHIPIQMERFFELSTETLPPVILLSFTANDFCSRRALEETPAQRTATFIRNLDEAWKKSAPWLARPHANGTQVIVLAQYNVAHVLTNPEILNQKVFFQGYGETTCRQLRSGEPGPSWASDKLKKTLDRMCPSVLETRLSDTARIQHLRAIQDLMNEAWIRKIAELNQTYAGKGVKWTYLEDIRRLPFGEGDVTNDCFHPSVRGYSKIADLILRQAFGR